MPVDKFASLNADWETDPAGRFTSASENSEPYNQALIFEDRFKDGALSAKVTPIAGQTSQEFGYVFCECALLLRFRDKDNFYAAGIGGFGRKYFLAKVLGSEWLLLAGHGFARDLHPGKTFSLKASVVGDQITLFDNEVPFLSSTDGTLSVGRCGLRTNRTKARFEQLDLRTVPPQCFVVMPFDDRFNPIYDSIVKTVKDHKLECTRSDEVQSGQPVMEDVKRRIAEADVVIIDFTGRNPNVYYEAGLADALQKNWILLARSKEDLAFDVQHLGAIIYLNEIETLQERLSGALAKIFRTAL
jgi:hypothetical protein